MVGRAAKTAGLALAIGLAACDGEVAPTPAAAASDSGTAAAPSAAPVDEKFCATRPALQFCEDFDEGALPGRFGLMSGEGALATDATLSRSLPNSLKVTADPSRGAAVAARLEKSFSAGKKLRGFAIVRAALRAPNDGAALKLMSMRFALAGGGRYEIAIATDATGAWAAHETRSGAPNPGDGGSDRIFPASRALEPETWTPIRFEVDFDGQGSGKLSVRFGADSVVDAVSLTPPAEALAPTFVLGLDGTAPSTPWSVNFDTVTFSVD